MRALLDRVVAERIRGRDVCRHRERVPVRVDRPVDERRAVFCAARLVELVVDLVGILRSGEGLHVVAPEDRIHPAHHVADHSVVARLRERAMRLRVDREQLGVVLEHLLVMRDIPFTRCRVTEEAALDLVVHAARGHRAERLVQHVREVRVAVASVFIEQEAKEADLRELGRPAEAAELRVVLSADQRADGVDDVRRQLAALRLARRGLVLAQLSDATGDLLAFGGPHLVDAVQRLPHLLGRDVRAAVDDLALRREEDGAGPAAHVVAAVHVGALVVVDAHRDVAVVDDLDDVGDAVAGLVHDVTPVAPHCADREQHGLVRLARLAERGITPRAPPDLVRTVGPRREAELAHSGISSSSILLPNGSNT